MSKRSRRSVAKGAEPRKKPTKYAKINLPQYGAKMYVPIYMGRLFPERAQKTASLAEEEWVKIEQEVFAELAKASEETVAKPPLESENQFHPATIQQTPPPEVVEEEDSDNADHSE